MSSLTPVRQVILKNNGGFVCKMVIRWLNPGSNDWDEAYVGPELNLGQSHTCDPAKHGAVVGAALGVKISVEAGDDQTNDPRGLIYNPTGGTAVFTASGTTLDSSLGFDGV